MLKNKTIFITGASSGIGAACAKLFAQSGANLLLCARQIDVLNQLAAPLQKEHNIKIYTFQLDVSQHHEVNTQLNKLPSEWQIIDILVNNAGLGLGLEPLQNGNPQEWDIMIDTNVKGLLYITKAVLPKMIERNLGHIINIGSIAGHQVYPNGAVYCATKHAVNALTQGLRMDLLGTNIRVSTIDPGAVETNFSLVRFKGDKKRAAAVYEGIQPLTPEDIADAVAYAAIRPPHVNISEIIIMPTAQASTSLIARQTK